MVVLTSFLIHRGSAESKDSNDRMEAKLDAIHRKLDSQADDAEPGRIKTEKPRT